MDIKRRGNSESGLSSKVGIEKHNAFEGVPVCPLLSRGKVKMQTQAHGRRRKTQEKQGTLDCLHQVNK